MTTVRCQDWSLDFKQRFELRGMRIRVKEDVWVCQALSDVCKDVWVCLGLGMTDWVY